MKLINCLYSAAEAQRARRKIFFLSDLCVSVAKTVVCIIAASVFTVPAEAADEALNAESGWNASFAGYYKNLFMYRERGTFYDINIPQEERRMVSDLNRIKLSPEITWSDRFIFHTDAGIEAVFSNYGRTAVFDSYWIEKDYNDFTRPSAELLYNEKVYVKCGIQNIYMKMVLGSITGTLGRQQVRFGGSRLWNPLDLLNPFSPVLVEGADEQKGIDALRIDWYPFDSTEVTAVVNPARENGHFRETSAGSGNYIARVKIGVTEFDAALIAGYTAKRKNYGCDFQWIVFDGMLTGVVLYSDPQEGKSFYQCGAGYEYTFASGLYLLAEYFYNSLPVNEDWELGAALYSSSMTGINESSYYVLSNRMVTFNSYYISAAAGFDFHPLVHGDFFAIYDFQGRGLFLNISLKINTTQNSEINAGIICSFIDENDRMSDFREYDRKPLLYASGQVYF